MRARSRGRSQFRSRPLPSPITATLATAAWTFNVPMVSADFDRFHEISARPVAWSFTLPQPSIAHSTAHGGDAGDASWSFDVPQPAVDHRSAHGAVAGDAAWAFDVPEPTVSSYVSVTVDLTGFDLPSSPTFIRWSDDQLLGSAFALDGGDQTTFRCGSCGTPGGGLVKLESTSLGQMTASPPTLRRRGPT